MRAQGKFIDSRGNIACVFSSRLPPLQMRSIPLERSFVTMRLHGTPRHTSHSISQTNEQEASYFRTFVKLVASRWSCCRSRGTNSAGTLDFSVRIASRRRSIPPNLTSLILTVLYVFVYRMKIWIYPMVVNFCNLFNLYRTCFHLREFEINFIVHHIIYEKYICIYMYIRSLQIFQFVQNFGKRVFI